ncbi:MAG: hypothetical protein DRO36_00210 [Candidatus Hecatellales archaeon]|nr:MAG: hypothetical protein DRO36_00210 [Candidatus Hecatellales archaeon]
MTFKGRVVRECAFHQPLCMTLQCSALHVLKGFSVSSPLIIQNINLWGLGFKVWGVFSFV